MRGYAVNVVPKDINNDPVDMFEENLLMKLYDNDELVVDSIGTMDFQYLTPVDYEGQHTLTLTYYREGTPELESDLVQFFTANFTLPELTLTFTVELLS